MARTKKPHEYALKRGEILDAAQRLVFTKGYEQMSVQDVLEAADISSGAFHHYFGSRAAMLEAFIERIQQESEKPLLPVIHDPHLTAVQKLQGFFDTLDAERLTLKAEVAKLARVWYTDANAVVRQKVDAAIQAQRAPLIAEIVRQGVREGLFSVADPDLAGEVVMSLIQAMGNTHARLLLQIAQEQDDGALERVDGLVDRIVAVHAAYMQALERVLGAPANCLVRTDAAAVGRWVGGLSESDPSP